MADLHAANRFMPSRTESGRRVSQKSCANQKVVSSLRGGAPESRGFCEICAAPPGKRTLHLDHCHVSLTFRGWLCASCNMALGHFKDDPRILRRAASYIEKHRYSIQST